MLNLSIHFMIKFIMPVHPLNWCIVGLLRPRPFPLMGGGDPWYIVGLLHPCRAPLRVPCLFLYAPTSYHEDFNRPRLERHVTAARPQSLLCTRPPAAMRLPSAPPWGYGYSVSPPG